jgi:bifunctional N-acetylglucosamine-1-phosphate-uridyltransferase/glucosamine-1-phosphate-acetyltransferase GlmU-like protein
MQIIIPMAIFDSFENSNYPKFLNDIEGKTLIEQVVNSLHTKKHKQSVYFLISDLYEKRFSASSVLYQIKGVKEVIVLKKPTSGAIATILMGINHYNQDDSVLIASHDQVLQINIDNFLNFCKNTKSNASVITFDSIHPKWSHVRTVAPNKVIQASGREAISRIASSGIYYFKSLKRFLDLSKNLILKNYNFPEGFYTNLVLNEYILNGEKVTNFHVKKEKVILYK